MMRVRAWVVGVVGAAVIAVAVLAATEHQRATADTNFREAQAAEQMQVAITSQERGLDGFLGSGQPAFLAVLYRGQAQLTRGLADARQLATDDATEAQAIEAQAAAFAQWRSLANAAIVGRLASAAADDSAAHERQRNSVIDAFLSANDGYLSRLLANRSREERDAALIPVWVLLGLGALFAAVALAATRRRRNDRIRLDAASFEQARFVEAIQFAESEHEAHELLTDHLENAIAGATVLVLNRNNSADRLEPATPLDDRDPLTATLLAAQPRSCLAIRHSRRYDRGHGGEQSAAFRCAICGALSRPSSCQPLLVGGTVIGSVLVGHDERLSLEVERRLQDTVTQAGPVLANLRNLGIAEGRAATDALTELPNRRSVDDTLRRMVAQADRAVSPLSVALIDVDRFKQVNDTYGHERGDEVLAAVAGVLRSELRASDFAGRNGGEEFVLFLPDTDRSGGTTAAEKVREALHKLRIAGVQQPITASFGVATFPDDATTPEALMRVADRALYSAKQLGRDRVETALAASPAAAVLVGDPDH